MVTHSGGKSNLHSCRPKTRCNNVATAGGSEALKLRGHWMPDNLNRAEVNIAIAAT